jgi:hypothetical protein
LVTPVAVRQESEVPHPCILMVQDSPSTFITHLAVIYIEFLFFGERGKKKAEKKTKKRGRGKTTVWQFGIAVGSHIGQASGAVLCYKKLI